MFALEDFYLGPFFNFVGPCFTNLATENGKTEISY